MGSRIFLISKRDELEFTKNLYKDVLESLDLRYGNLIKNVVFVVSTFLDPNFGFSPFPLNIRHRVKKIIRELVSSIQVIIVSYTFIETINNN